MKTTQSTKLVVRLEKIDPVQINSSLNTTQETMTSTSSRLAVPHADCISSNILEIIETLFLEG
jgi:hypothetical protein